MLRYNVPAGQISASSYHIASQPPGRDVNGPVYRRMKLRKGKHNLQLASQRLLPGVLRFLNWKLAMFEADVYLRGWSVIVAYTSIRHIWCANSLCLLL